MKQHQYRVKIGKKTRNKRKLVVREEERVGSSNQLLLERVVESVGTRTQKEGKGKRADGLRNQKDFFHCRAGISSIIPRRGGENGEAGRLWHGPRSWAYQMPCRRLTQAPPRKDSHLCDSFIIPASPNSSERAAACQSRHLHALNDRYFGVVCGADPDIT